MNKKITILTALFLSALGFAGFSCISQKQPIKVEAGFYGPNFDGDYLVKKGTYFDIRYGLNTSGTISLEIVKNSGLPYYSIYKWSLGKTDITDANSSSYTTVKYLGQYDIYAWGGTQSGGYTGTSVHEVLDFDPIITGIKDVNFYQTDLYISGAKKYNLTFTELDGTGQQTATTECDYSGPYYHSLSDIGNYTIKAYMRSTTGSYYHIFEKTYQVLSVISGVEDGKTYNGSASFQILDNTYTVKLDNSTIAGTGSFVNTVGNHTITVSKGEQIEEINFVVEPTVSYLSDGGIYQSSVTPYFSGGTLSLDGEPFTSGTTINQPGNHTIVVTGVNGYQKTYAFTVNLSDSGIANNGVYYQPVSYTFSGGNATLDGEPYVSGTKIDSLGEHAIIVGGSGTFQKTTNFKIPWIIDWDSGNTVFTNEFTPVFISNESTLDNVDFESGTKITEIGNHVLKLSGYGETKNYSFTIVPEIINVENGKTYKSSVTPIISGGTLILDGEPFTSGTTINQPGSHVLTITGVNGYSDTISFNIALEDSGIEDGDTFIDSASYTFSGGTATLDGQNYISSTEITEIGNHTIVIHGSSDYEKTINFVIEPSITGIIDGGIYTSSVTPSISGGTIYLDENPFISGTTINQPGNHIITISGANNYLKTISFFVSLIDSGIEDGDTFIDSASYTFSGGTATLDGQNYISSTEITEIGNHTIVIHGSSDYEKTINFVIEPSITGIIDGGIYTSSVTPSISGGNISLDGESFSSGDTVSVIGNHRIIITGSNDYSKTVDFTIEPIISGVENGGTYNSSATPIINGGSLFLDDEPYVSGTEITIPGSHSLLILGTNNYSQTIVFTIGLTDSGIINNGVYYESVSYNFSGGSATLDGDNYISGTTISEIGNHTIVVTGSNNFKKTINFEIKAIEYSIEHDDYSWTINISNSHPDTVVKVDEIIIHDSYSETKIGNHTLSITNANGYEKTISFVVKEKVSFKDGETTNNPIVIENIEADVYVDGVKVNSGYRIDQNGTHTIEIVGDNGYSATYRITFQNLNYNYAAIIVAPTCLAIALVVFMFVKRRRIL